MGIRYSELNKINNPYTADLVAVLHDNSTLVTTTLQEAVDCTLGTDDISSIGDGTVKGAIKYIADNSSGTAIAATYVNYQQYMAVPEATRKDGRFRLVMN